MIPGLLNERSCPIGTRCKMTFANRMQLTWGDSGLHRPGPKFQKLKISDLTPVCGTAGAILDLLRFSRPPLA